MKLPKDAVDLLQYARDAGLRFEIDGDKLVISGKKEVGEPLMEHLAKHKTDVMRALQADEALTLIVARQKRKS